MTIICARSSSGGAVAAENNPYLEIPAYGPANLHLTWESKYMLWQAILLELRSCDRGSWRILKYDARITGSKC